MAPSGFVASHRVETLLDSMSIEQLIGQMSQIDLKILLDDDTGDDATVRVNLSKLEYYIGHLGIGSVLNNVVGHQWNSSQFRSAVVEMQRVAKKYNHPPIIYGLDSIHGANYIRGATLTPQPINLAATFNTTMAYRAGILASRDTRAAGISWLFSPLLGVALNPRWSRLYETFGEDMLVVGQMAKSMIMGIQAKESTVGSTSSSHGDNTSQQQGGIPSRAAASAKHFIGYSAPRTGHDRAPSWIPTRHLYQYFVPPWRHVADEVLTIMEAYTEYDGVPVVTNRHALQTLLRFQLEFNGVVVTDYSEMWNLVEWHHVSKDRTDAVAASIRAGVDMSMIPFDAEEFVRAVKEAIASNQLDKDHVRNAARRVLTLKETLNMFDETVTMEDVNLAKVGTDREEALEMVRQSIVLVKNENNLLPLPSKENIKVLVTGPTANSLSFQSGGWTWQWQGAADSWFPYGTTVLDAAKELPWQVTYQCGTDIMGSDCGGDSVPGIVNTVESFIGFGSDIPPSIKAASEQDADYVIVCVGEENYTEKPGDINDLALPEGQRLLVQQLAAKAKIIIVYFGGRPRLLGDIEPLADAILLGFLPGPDAGKAVIEIISGMVNPSGRLPITYPKHEDLQGVPYFHAVSEECTLGSGQLPHFQYGLCDTQWPFGYGLSFTSFEYSNLQVNSNTVEYTAPGQSSMYRRGVDSLVVSVQVTNTGSVAGRETVMFFSFDEYRSVTPEYKRLRSFEKVDLAPGESITVIAAISPTDLKFIGPDDDSHLIVEDGMVFRIGVGAATDCRDDGDDAMCTEPVTVAAGAEYIGACEAACDVWTRSICSAMLRPRGCYSMCSEASQGGPLKEGWYVYICVPHVVYLDPMKLTCDGHLSQGLGIRKMHRISCNSKLSPRP